MFSKSSIEEVIPFTFLTFWVWETNGLGGKTGMHYRTLAFPDWGLDASEVERIWQCCQVYAENSWYCFDYFDAVDILGNERERCLHSKGNITALNDLLQGIKQTSLGR